MALQHSDPLQTIISVQKMRVSVREELLLKSGGGSVELKAILQNMRGGNACELPHF
jgi:hypothetical protein